MYSGESPAFIPVEAPDKSPDLLIKDLEDTTPFGARCNILWVTSPSRLNLFTFLLTDWFQWGHCKQIFKYRLVLPGRLQIYAASIAFCLGPVWTNVYIHFKSLSFLLWLSSQIKPSWCEHGLKTCLLSGLQKYMTTRNQIPQVRVQNVGVACWNTADLMFSWC